MRTRTRYFSLFARARSENYPRAERVVTVADNLLERPARLRTVSGVDHDAVPDYMNAADALLLTSHSEGSPNSVKEALACNLPVVAVDVGDVRERLAGVEPSRVAASDEELVGGSSTFSNPASDRTAARPPEVSIDRMADRMLEVYEEVAGQVIETKDVREKRRVAERHGSSDGRRVVL